LLVGGLGRSARAIEQRTGITNAQLFLLQQLAGSKTMSVNELAARARTQQSTVSVVIARLVRAGLVRKERSATDARTAALSLTPAGRRLVRRAPAPPTALLLDAIESMRGSEASQLASSLGALVRALGLESRKPELLFERDSGPES
jgi:DNA-binding MarR family transcriptional regulator